MSIEDLDTELDLDAIRAWALMCGSCDAGLPMDCTCPRGDPRPVVARLIFEVERLRIQVQAARLAHEVERLRRVVGDD